MAQWVKNLSAMQETQEMEASVPGSGRSPGGEGMTTRSNTLAWKNPMDREAWWTVIRGVMELDMTEWQQQSAPC